ncbi:MAG: hypothetical protein EP330_23500 [Deltaproteobacteria bacterium]|nr:MAG: hypothetical protein EP330_23500 [Deltaproteobacteria bacterium]
MNGSAHFSRVVLSVALAIGGGVLGFMLFCFVTGQFLDPHMEITVERELDAPPEAVAALVTSPEGALRWWKQAGELHGENRISERITVEQIDNGLEFRAGTAVFEQWTLIEADETSASWSIDFQKDMTSTRDLSVSPAADGKSLLVWRESVEIDSPYLRWMARLPQQNLEANFQSAMHIAEVAAQTPPAEELADEPEAEPADDTEGSEADAPEAEDAE